MQCHYLEIINIITSSQNHKIIRNVENIDNEQCYHLGNHKKITRLFDINIHDNKHFENTTRSISKQYNLWNHNYINT